MGYLAGQDSQPIYHEGAEASGQTFHFQCPQCGGSRTYYSATFYCWCCQVCGQMFNVPEALLLHEGGSLPMKVYNLHAKETIPMRFPGDIMPGDVWLLAVPAPKPCHHCHLTIGSNAQHVVAVDTNLASACSYHLNCMVDDDLIEAVAELM